MSMDDEELASLVAVGEAAWQWTAHQHHGNSFTRIEWRLVEAVENYREMKQRQRKEREGS